MSFINKYPYSDMHEMNLDWIISKIINVEKTNNSFIALNQIKWLGDWDISKDYTRWSLVDDGSGNGYIAISPVPAGIALNNSNYWAKISEYNGIYTAFNSRITALETQNGNAPLTTVSQTLSEAINELDSDIENIVNVIYPIGSMYISTDATSPASLFGGVWSPVYDKFIVANGSTFSPNTSGGSQSHNHSLYGTAFGLIDFDTSKLIFRSETTGTWTSTVHKDVSGAFSSVGTVQSRGIDITGTTDTKPNLPPYSTYYIWTRIS